jgi:hypothetical protein
VKVGQKHGTSHIRFDAMHFHKSIRSVYAPFSIIYENMTVVRS